MARKLTAKQVQFCKEYMIDLNGTQAAIRAGYSKNTAKEIASENLTKPNIIEYVAELMGDRSKRTEITADRVLEEIAKLAFFNMGDVLNDEGGMKNLNEWGRDDLAAVGEVTETIVKAFKEDDGEITSRKVKLSDKKSSLELLGRHLKLFTDKVELGGSLNITHEEWLDNLNE